MKKGFLRVFPHIRIRVCAQARGIKPKLVLASLIMFLFCSAGCWDRKELSDLAIVAGIGMDWEEQTEEYVFTAQIIKPSQVKSPQSAGGGGGGGGEKAVWVAQTKAKSVFKGVRNFLFKSSRRLYFPHNQIVVIGKNAAKRGVGPLLDIFLRDQEPRMSEKFLIAEEQAAEVLQAQTELEVIPAIALSRLLDNYKGTSEVAQVTLWDFTLRLLSKTSAPYAPMVKIEGEGEEKKHQVFATAVFKKDRYIGELNKRETRGLLWTLGEVQGGIITVDYTKDEGKCKGLGWVDLEILRSSAKIVPEVTGGSVRMRVEVTAETNLGANLTSIDFSTPGLLRDLNARQAQVIKEEVQAAVKKAQALQVDIFAFGEAVQRKFPREWQKLEGNWPEIFARLDPEIQVRTNLRLVGLTTRPTMMEGREEAK